MNPIPIPHPAAPHPVNTLGSCLGTSPKSRRSLAYCGRWANMCRINTIQMTLMTFRGCSSPGWVRKEVPPPFSLPLPSFPCSPWGLSASQSGSYRAINRHLNERAQPLKNPLKKDCNVTNHLLIYWSVNLHFPTIHFP